MQNPTRASNAAPWRLQDAKAQFSALVDSALRGVPQHVTRSGKRAVVVLSEVDFEALQRSAASRAHASVTFVDHLLAIPKSAVDDAPDAPDASQLNVQPRDVDFS
jgi:antitoxin Phd